MASGYQDSIRDVEAEKAIVLRDNPQLTEADLIVEKNAIGITLEGLAKIKAGQVKKEEVVEVAKPIKEVKTREQLLAEETKAANAMV